MPDAALGIEYTAVGRYDVVADGVGLKDSTSGTINDFNVPGTIEQAYLFWAGYDDNSGDKEVDLTRDSDPLTTVTLTAGASETYGPDWWFGSYDHYVYVKDVTSYVQTGPHDYTISDVSMGENYGAGLMVVYQHASLPNSVVKIYYGLDSFHFLFGTPRGPDSEVVCVDIDAVGYTREMSFTLFVGGLEHDNRPNDIWYQTGEVSDPIPTDLIGTGTAIDGDGWPYPLGAYDGNEWDTYTNSISVLEDDAWVCIQLESIVSLSSSNPHGGDPRSNEGLGTSALFIAAGFVLPIPIPGTGTPGYWKNHPEAWPVDEITIGGIVYTDEAVIAIMKTKGTKGDKTYTMFSQLVAAKLNVLIGNPHACIDDIIDAADQWMDDYGPVESEVVKAKSAAWDIGEPIKNTLDDYNNGLMCAPHRD